MSKADTAENKTLDWCVGRTIAPITAYVALYTAAPSDAGGGTEVIGCGYIRRVTSSSDWTVTANGSVANAVHFDFPIATANYPAPVTHWGLLDASTNGNLIRWGALNTPKTIALNGVPRFFAGSLVLTED